MLAKLTFSVRLLWTGFCQMLSLQPLEIWPIAHQLIRLDARPRSITGQLDEIALQERWLRNLDPPQEIERFFRIGCGLPPCSHLRVRTQYRHGGLRIRCFGGWIEHDAWFPRPQLFSVQSPGCWNIKNLDRLAIELPLLVDNPP